MIKFRLNPIGTIGHIDHNVSMFVHPEQFNKPQAVQIPMQAHTETDNEELTLRIDPNNEFDSIRISGDMQKLKAEHEAQAEKVAQLLRLELLSIEQDATNMCPNEPKPEYKLFIYQHNQTPKSVINSGAWQAFVEASQADAERKFNLDLGLYRFYEINTNAGDAKIFGAYIVLGFFDLVGLEYSSAIEKNVALAGLELEKS